MKVLSSNIIPRGEALGAQRWQPRPVDPSQRTQSAATSKANDATGNLPNHAEELARKLDAENQIARARATKEGFEQGLAEGRAQGARDVAELRLLLVSLREVSQALEHRLADRVVALAIDLAQVMTRKSLQLQPQLIVEVVRDVIASLPEHELHTEIVVHPEDARVLREALRSDPNAALPWHVSEDATMTRGGCRIARRASDIDASIEARWQRVMASLGRSDAWVAAPVREVVGAPEKP
jgi:flagellar assembly protein FliH